MIPKYYRKVIGGIMCDPYRLAKLLGITDHSMFTIFKKIIRAGNKDGHTRRKEMEDIRDAVERWIEMDDEDAISAIKDDRQGQPEAYGGSMQP